MAAKNQPAKTKQTEQNNEGRLLPGKKELLTYLNETGCNIGEKALDALIRAGLPGVRIGGKLYFHTQNVDLFLLKVTRQRVTPEDETDVE